MANLVTSCDNNFLFFKTKKQFYNKKFVSFFPITCVGRWINWLDIQESYVWKTQIKNGELENLIYMNVVWQLF